MNNNTNQLLCPFMGGEPCMGKECACAVANDLADTDERIYGCGLANINCEYGIFSQVIDIERTDT